MLSARKTTGICGKGFEGRQAVISGERLTIAAYDDTSFYGNRSGENYTKEEMTELVKFLLDQRFVSILDVMNRERFEALCEQ